MEVILLQDVRSLGKKGDKVNVKDGYGRNLIAKQLGAEATAKVMNDLRLQKLHEDKVAGQKLQEAQELAGKLAGTSITVFIKTGKDGKAFGSVSSKEITEACKAQLGLEVDKKKLVLPEAIKEVGKTKVTLKLHPQVNAVLTINVLQE